MWFGERCYFEVEVTSLFRCTCFPLSLAPWLLWRAVLSFIFILGAWDDSISASYTASHQEPKWTAGLQGRGSRRSKAAPCVQEHQLQQTGGKHVRTPFLPWCKCAATVAGCPGTLTPKHIVLKQIQLPDIVRVWLGLCGAGHVCWPWSGHCASLWACCWDQMRSCLQRA